jgi:ABC-type phosphate transport system ATPase subunit
LNDGLNPSDKMAALQKLRVGVVVLLSEETSKLLSRRQKLSGKQIERMCVERDLVADPESTALSGALDDVIAGEHAAQALLEESEEEIGRLESLLSKIQADISALHQA